MEPRTAVAIVIAAVLVIAATPASANDEASAAASESAPCCFENPRFSGTCQVTPSGDETCSSILAYLNNPNSVGKAYCGNTKVRGGWTQVSCEDAAAVTRDTACAAVENRQ
jgi:hypothetical protein